MKVFLNLDDKDLERIVRDALWDSIENLVESGSDDVDMLTSLVDAHNFHCAPSQHITDVELQVLINEMQENAQ